MTILQDLSLSAAVIDFETRHSLNSTFSFFSRDIDLLKKLDSTETFSNTRLTC